MTQYTREITRTLECGPGPRIEIRTVHGPVRVRGADHTGVHLAATLRFRAESDEEADELVEAFESGLSVEGERVRIQAPALEGGRKLFGGLRGAFGSHHRVEIELSVSAPWGASVSIHHINGIIELQELQGDARVRLVNGDVNARDIGGSVRMSHVNGKTIVRNAGGRVDVHQTNGDVEVVRTGGDIKLNIVNGRVDIREPGRAVAVRGVSGAYSLSGPIRDHVSMANGHGTITLNLPRDSRFQLDARSALGRVTSELEVREGDGAGARAPRVSLRSETGSIELRALREAAVGGV